MSVDNNNHTQEETNQCVYMHISPTGKRYIGRCACPITRWRSKGSGYKDNTLFWTDIQQYGWDNFEHIIIAENLDKTAATQLESELIHQYMTIYPENGYNQLTGGKYKGEISNTYRKKLQSIQLNFRSFSNSCWVSKENEAILIPRDLLDIYLETGYREGRSGENAIYINKDGITKRIKGIEIDKYIADGWLLGKSDRIAKNVRKSRQKYIWMCDGIEFASAQALATYLRTKYYPKIVPSTITSIFRGAVYPAYPDLLKIVSRRPVEH